MTKQWYISKITKKLTEMIPAYSESVIKSLELDKMTMNQIKAISFIFTYLELVIFEEKVKVLPADTDK